MTTPDIAGLGEHLSNETEARLRAEVERNTAPFRTPDIAGLCKKLRFSETCISTLAAEVDRLTDTLERQDAEIERLRRALMAAQSFIADGGLAETDPGASIYHQVTAALTTGEANHKDKP